MKANQPTLETIDAYIACFPEEVQERLQQIRAAIKKAAPDAVEAISYQIPTFKLNGNLVHFGAFKKHIGFYPTPSGIAAFKNELIGYETSRGAVQFPFNQPLPLELVSRIVEFRVAEARKRVSQKAKRPKATASNT